MREEWKKKRKVSHEHIWGGGGTRVGKDGTGTKKTQEEEEHGRARARGGGKQPPL